MDNQFGQRLREVREMRGLTQSKLAELCDIKSPAVLSYWESGRNKPDTDKLVVLCHALSVSPNYLLGIEDAPNGLSFEAMAAAKKLDQLDDFNRMEMLNAIDMRLLNAGMLRAPKQSNAGGLYLSPEDPDYYELKKQSQQFRELKRDRYRGYEDITKHLWDYGYNPDQVCLTYVIQIFTGKRVPCRELYERILAYLTNDLRFIHKDGRPL